MLQTSHMVDMTVFVVVVWAPTIAGTANSLHVIGGHSVRGDGECENWKGPSARSGIRHCSTGVAPSAGTSTPANGDAAEGTVARSGVPWPKVVLASTRDPAVASPETQNTRRPGRPL